MATKRVRYKKSVAPAASHSYWINPISLFWCVRPGRVLALLADVPAGAPVRLANLTLQARSCGPLWRMQEDECTMRVSAYWPSTGLEVREFGRGGGGAGG